MSVCLLFEWFHQTLKLVTKNIWNVFVSILLIFIVNYNQISLN